MREVSNNYNEALMSDLIDLLRESIPHQILFSMLVVAVAGTFILYVLEKKKNKKTDVEKLFDAARQYDCSEFDIFTKTGIKWNIPEKRVKEDFKNYLLYGDIPFYIRDFLRSDEQISEKH